MLKPEVETEQVTALLRTCFDQPITQLAPLGTGHVARVFSFLAGEQAYVVRLLTPPLAAAFRQEQFIAELLAATEIPLPPILHQGTWQDLAFAISPKVPGIPLNELSMPVTVALIPQTIEMLDRIHQIEVNHTTGWGPFDENGVGQLPDWSTFLLRVMEEEGGDGFWGQWHYLFTESFLERALFERVLAEMQALLPYLPQTRFLVHGDYGFNNVLAADGQITAVLDWANAMFGDFVYDIARLDFFAPGLAYDRRCQEYYDGPGRSVSHFTERLRCYACYTGLNALRFYAKVGQRQAYEWARQRMLDILDAAPTQA